jgi:ribonuclease R
MAKSSKQERTAANLKKTILQFMKGRRYRPMEESELFERLQVASQLEPLFQKIIKELVKEGELEIQNKKLVVKKPQEEVITGILRVHHKGFGFLIPDSPSMSAQDVFIPKHLTDNAVDGDHVEVVLNPEMQWEKGPEGKVVSVLKRAHKHLAGTIKTISSSGDIVVYAPLLGTSKPVIVQSPADTSLKIGDRVVLKVLAWGREQDQTTAEITHVIGNISNPAIDIEAASEEFNLNKTFTKTALEQAKSFKKKIPAKDLKERTDFTDLECFTIDPDTARDFDDALSLTKDRKGIYHLGVHIADAAHYVEPDTALDREALLRCNSTYFPGACLPMLPEELSNELCSLKPDVIRLTISVMMDFDKEGTLIKHEIVRSFIHSKKRFTYGEAKEVLDGEKKSPHAKTLKHMVDLCLLLKKKRHERGSIDFSLPEMVILVDEQGQPTGMKKIEYDITHQLVEEFMLKANEVVATDLTQRGKSLLYRVHEAPSEDNFKDFVLFANSLGFKIPANPSVDDLRTLFEQAKKTAFASQLSIAFIRSMKLAQYSPENIGHYGLSLEYYCHFTSPIRRYSDLVTQRRLFDEEPKDLNLDKIAERCSEQERLSFKAEMSVKTLKKLRLLNAFFKEDPLREFPAVVTKVKPFGLHFELTDLMLEGFLHISELENDYFTYDAKRSVLIGSRTGKTHRLGETLTVQLVAVDLIFLESRWALVTPHARQAAPSHPRQAHPQRRRSKKK